MAKPTPFDALLDHLMGLISFDLGDVLITMAFITVISAASPDCLPPVLGQT